MTAYTVSSGQTSSGITLNAGDTLTVLSGGTVEFTTVNGGSIGHGPPGASLTVSSGGRASFDIVRSGGSETVLSGGSASFEEFEGFETVSGGTVSLSRIADGNLTVVAGGSTSSDTVDGGSVIVSSGGTTTSDTINSNAGSEIVFAGGIANSVTAHGLVRVSGGITNSVTLGNLGEQNVAAGGSALATTVSSGGFLRVSSGGTASGTTLLSGGILELGGGAINTGLTWSGGTLDVNSGFTLTGQVVSAGQELDVGPAGAATSTTINSGGSLDVLFGGKASFDTISTGGSETVSLGGTVASPSINGSGAVLDLLFGSIVSGGVTFGGSGGELQIGGTAMPSNTISGFVSGDTFDLTSIAFDSTGTVNLAANNQLQITEGSTTYDLNLDPGQDFTGASFHLASDGTTGTLVTEDQNPCFCRGTLIRTEAGEVPVEQLAIGDMVMTLSGAAKPIVWIGFGRSLVTRGNREARPVIVRRGALADDVPARDLYLSHGHALYFDGVLIPVEHLVNHRSILSDDAARVIEYYHIELEDHDVLFAEGAPAETYHDAGNRAFFHNARAGSGAGADKPTFAPVLHDGDIVGEVWAELFARAGSQLEGNTTDDADLHLVVDGLRIDATAVVGGVYSFTVEWPPAAMLQLCSRAGVPSLLGLDRHDHRSLGVAIKQLILDHAGIATSFDYDAPQFREGGCHRPEAGYCWTDGEFALPMRFFTLLNGHFTLVVYTKPHYDMRYPISPQVTRAA